MKSKADNIFLFIFSIPSFWLATMVLIYFNSPEYGMQIFQSPLYVEVEEGNFFSILIYGFSKLSPIIFCICLLDIAYLTRMFLANLSQESQKPYVDILKTRGLSAKVIKLKHLYPNVMLPLVTLIIGSLPLSLAGSLIYEVVFNVPGMGRLLYDSIVGADWKVVYSIILLVFFLTIILYSIGDLLYEKIDSRISEVR
jgi:peptide/nickel transport system permease protein